MRLQNFSPGDLVRITRTPLTGTLVKVGGKIGVVNIGGIPVRYPLSRIRHTVPAGERFLKKVAEIKKRVVNLVIK
jgi:hypothetical protein